MDDREKDIEIIKRALDLETRLQNISFLLSELRKQIFDEIPIPERPVRKKAQASYPTSEDDESTQFGCARIFLAVFGIFIVLLFAPLVMALTGSFVVTAVYVVAATFGIISLCTKRLTKGHKKDAAEKAEIQREHAEFDTKVAKEQEGYDEEFRLSLDAYTQELQVYNKARDAWKEDHEKKIALAETGIALAQQELDALYAESPIVPSKYHTVDALEFILDTMTSSMMDVNAAVEVYERHLAQLTLETRLAEQQATNVAAAVAANEMIARQNEILEEQLEVASKTRRDQDIAAVIGTVQRHGINKKLKDLTDKK